MCLFILSHLMSLSICQVTQLKRQIVVSRKILPEQYTTQLALDSAQKQVLQSLPF